MSDNTEFISPNERGVSYLRYPAVCNNPKFTHKVLDTLRSEKFEVGNYNWGRTLDQILQIKEKFERSGYICNNMINLSYYPPSQDEEILKITHIINTFNQ